ncbi:MAG: protein-L-isoaspartate(D-aspartate) O-methyltransferase [Planctomycetales bacterium]|nr:protein-L-isoaspartate(D-aspartate) O-methyltransferase [Planctomycetales bacterium]
MYSSRIIWYSLFLLPPAIAADAAEDYSERRAQMVAQEIEAAGVTHPQVLNAMRSTPRHEFVPTGFRHLAYLDAALPIGDQQTISPPFVVAYMTQELDPQPTDRVLEIGTGSGYQAAVLSPLVSEVYTIEIVGRLGRRAERTLSRLMYKNVHVRVGDGYLGWPEHAPFDKIIVTCSPESVPQPLVDQLKEGGQMIIPVGERYQQNLFRMTKREGKLEQETLRATLFVPMTGTAEQARQVLPDPTRPAIVNGGFEDVLEEGPLPAAWHYLRQARVIDEHQAAPAGRRYLSFANSEPGKASRALQGLALDGRAISQLRFSVQVRGRDLGPGPTPQQQPAAIITYYDQRRAVIDSESLGNWHGTFDWRLESKTLRVPLASREAIVRLGLLGGTGRLDLDEVQLELVFDK